MILRLIALSSGALLGGLSGLYLAGYVLVQTQLFPLSENIFATALVVGMAVAGAMLALVVHGFLKRRNG